MKSMHILSAALLLVASFSLSAQVSPKDVNGARNSASDGTSLDTNVSFSLRMTLSGEETLRDAANIGDEVSIFSTIRPETDDIGKSADIIVVDFLPPSLSMRNAEGNFVSWNGSLRTLVPSLEGITLEAEQDVEVFTGPLGATGNHRIFIGFAVEDVLYFTPTALRFDIEAAPEPEKTALELAVELFDSTISPTIIQTNCIACHVAGGAASGSARQIFVRTSNSNHLSMNFNQLENLHALTSTAFILNKAQGLQSHGGGTRLSSGSTGLNALSDFLELLDQASEE